MDPQSLQRCTDASVALAETLANDPNGWAEFLALDRAEMVTWLKQIPAHARIEAGDTASFKHLLYQTRKRLAYQIACIEILQLVPIQQTLAALSALADSLLQQAHERLFSELVAAHGTPRGVDGTAQGLCVLALGKLGGGELNFSSDIDLIFVFGEHGHSDGARSLDNETFFLRFGQRLIALLGDPSALVYRIDMRLRPFGEVGRLCLSVNALEHYYQSEGRDWERYAWIKARACAGDLVLGARVLQLLRPFVYRRYLDFTAISGLREMKREIERKVAREGAEEDLKLGRGGIREIEFIVQLEQLIRGGREASLRTHSLHRAITAQISLKPERAPEFEALRTHYALLRLVENRVQMAHDQQCHALPVDPGARERIARSLGFDSASALEIELAKTRADVRGAFERVLMVNDAPANALPPLHDWMHAMVERVRTLAAAERVSPRVLGYLDALLPQLAQRALASDLSPTIAERVFRLVAALLKRGTYLALIAEQPLVQERILSLAARSHWLVDALVEQPVLLDELIDPRLFELETRVEICTRLDLRLNGDLEADMDVLRQCKSAQLFRIGLSYLDARIDATTALARFSELTELLLDRVFVLAVSSVAKAMGLDPAKMFTSIAVIGYGSLGAAEVSPGSDLDLLFVLADDAEPGAAFRRVAQRLLHILTTQTGAGRLFEVDTRLKPNGSAGQLLTTLGAFERYQLQSAWTWEHQALVHARAVVGSSTLRGEFERIRAAVLSQRRDSHTVQTEIHAMLLRLRDTREAKHAIGGPTELKFAAELCVLTHAADHPQLLLPRSAAGIIACAQRLGLALALTPSDALRVDRWRLERALGLDLAPATDK